MIRFFVFFEMFLLASFCQAELQHLMLSTSLEKSGMSYIPMVMCLGSLSLKKESGSLALPLVS